MSFLFFLFFLEVFLSRETAAQTILEEVGERRGPQEQRQRLWVPQADRRPSWDSCGRSGAAAAAAKTEEQPPPPPWEPDPPLLQWVQPGSPKGSGGRRGWGSSHGGFAFAPRRGQGWGLG